MAFLHANINSYRERRYINRLHPSIARVSIIPNNIEIQKPSNTKTKEKKKERNNNVKKKFLDCANSPMAARLHSKILSVNGRMPIVGIHHRSAHLGTICMRDRLPPPSGSNQFQEKLLPSVVK